MEVNYWLILGFASIFFIGMFFGLYIVKFFSDEIIYKLENAFEDQLQKSQIFYKTSQKNIMTKIHEKMDIMEQINSVLAKTKELLSTNKYEIEKLNNACNTRIKLESEIIKLKKIIKRMEKKNELL